jgi:heterodisulfide reductase subunit A
VEELGRADRWPGVAFAGVHDLLCTPEGLSWLGEQVRASKLDRIVVAACSPREHEATFRKAAEAAGLSRWRVQIVNLREQVEWLGGDPAAATARAERLVRAGLARVAHHRDLPRREVEASPDVVVIGGGAAGLSAALRLAGRGRRVVLVERQLALGGLADQLDELFPDGACASCFMAPAIDDVLNHPEIDVLTGAEVTAVRGALGRFDVEVSIQSDGTRPRVIHAGAIVLATGMRPGEVEGPPGVLSTWQLERMLHPHGPTAGEPRGADGKPPRAVLLALAAGAAAADGDLAIDELLKLARALRHRLPEARVLLAGGLDRSPRHAPRVQALAVEGVEPLAADWIEGGVAAAGGRLAVRLRDGAGERTEEVDLLVVHAASNPAEGSATLATLLRIARDAHGFLDDAGPGPFEPTATRAAGIFVAGAAAGPRAIRAAIRDGAAVAGRILGELQPGEKLAVEPLAAVIDPLRCCGCFACATSCAFGAVTPDPETGKARVEPLHCRACGSCAAGCPTGSMLAPHATREQLASEISALLADGAAR